MAICTIALLFLWRGETRTIPVTSPVSPCVQLRAQMEQMSCSGTVAYDWGELAHYQQANSQIDQIKAGLPRVVFIGDSITLAWPELSTKGFSAGMDAVNRGITGQVTAQMLLRFRQDVVDLHPRVVVILGGSNDVAKKIPPALPIIEGNLASMAQLAKANGIRPVLSSIPPVSDYGHEENGNESKQTKTHSPEQIRELNDWIKKFAKENGCIFLDYYSAMVDDDGFLKKEYSEDGLHPNMAGYSVMRPLAERAIKAALD